MRETDAEREHVRIALVAGNVLSGTTTSVPPSKRLSIVAPVEQLILNRGDVITFLEQRREDALFLTAMWMARRRPIAKAIEHQALDVEAVEKLFALLGQDVSLTERQVVREGTKAMRRLDWLLRSECSLSTGLLESSRLVALLCRVWLVLEIRFRPDERNWLQALRERLTVRAEECEIDLRGQGL